MSNHRGRITYRFDHSGQSRNPKNDSKQESIPIIPLTSDEFSVVEESQPLNQFTSDFGSWSSPFDEETERVERAIRETGRSNVEDEPQKPLIVMDEDDEKHYQPTKELRNQVEQRNDGMNHSSGFDIPGGGRVSLAGNRLDRYSRTPWLKLVASVTGAIATGVLIGIFVLTLFSNDGQENDITATGLTNHVDKGPNGAVSPEASPNNPVLSSASPTSSSSAVTSAGATATVPVKIPVRTYTLLQYGAYMTAEGSEAAQTELRKLGLGVAVQNTDKIYVYAGLTSKADDAAAIKAKLQAQKTEVYAKTITFPSVSKIVWNGKTTESADSYFAQAAKLISSITNVTSLHLKTAVPGPIESNTLTAIHSLHQDWSTSINAMLEGLLEKEQSVLQKMNTALHTSVLALDEYKKNTSASFLWQAQSGVMQYVLLENELLNTIKTI